MASRSAPARSHDPAAGPFVERQQRRALQESEKALGEERVPGGLPQRQLRQRAHPFWWTAQGLGTQGLDGPQVQRLERERRGRGPGLARRLDQPGHGPRPRRSRRCGTPPAPAGGGPRCAGQAFHHAPARQRQPTGRRRAPAPAAAPGWPAPAPAPARSGAPGSRWRPDRPPAARGVSPSSRRSSGIRSPTTPALAPSAVGQPHPPALDELRWLAQQHPAGMRAPARPGRRRAGSSAADPTCRRRTAPRLSPPPRSACSQPRLADPWRTADSATARQPRPGRARPPRPAPPAPPPVRASRRAPASPERCPAGQARTAGWCGRLPLPPRLAQVGQQRLAALVTLLGHLGQQAQHDLRQHLGHGRVAGPGR